MVTGAVPAIVTDVILEKTGVLPSFAEQMEHGLHVAWMLLLALTYRLVYQALGSYVTARLVALAVLTPPTAWLGGKLATR